MKFQELLESPLATRLIGARHTGVDWHRLAMTCAGLLPDAQIWRLFQLSVTGVDVALCLHHVSRRYRDELTMPAHELDAFLERAAQIQNGGRSRWLTVSFDDGYLDAWHYIMTRARRFPNMDWLLFVCPAKSEHQTGFRWDLVDVDNDSPRDVRLENHRVDLKSAVQLSDTHLATVEQCRALRIFENVHLGNHTNCHFRPAALPLPMAIEELEQSHADFERLFGPEEHFAFPFGQGTDFGECHVESIRRATDAVIWSTVPRPFLAAHRSPGAVLPRFGVDGRWTAAQLAFLIAVRTLRARVNGLAPLSPKADEVTKSDFVAWQTIRELRERGLLGGTAPSPSNGAEPEVRVPREPALS